MTGVGLMTRIDCWIWYFYLGMLLSLLLYSIYHIWLMFGCMMAICWWPCY